MKKRKMLVAVALAALSAGTTQAQLKGVSFKLAPIGEYQWWNKNINLDNNVFYGIRAGFGFGPYFELHALAEKSTDLKGKLKNSNLNFSQSVLDKIPGSSINITRLGGEAKVNILSGTTIVPFVTGGFGVQYFDYNPFDQSLNEAKNKEQQLYMSLGAGINFRFSKNIGLSLEARDVIFNMDPTNPYFNVDNNNKGKRLHNFGAMASLNIYLGRNEATTGFGRKASYFFNSGFAHNVKFVIEPGVNYVNFRDSKVFPEYQWFVGGAVGADLSSLIGVRGFYYQANKNPETLNFKFNKKMSMYGGEIITRLNQPRGIVPYLTIGAGVLHTSDGYYEGLSVTDMKKDNLFGKLGVGLEIPLSRWFALYGSANAMFLTEPGIDAQNLQKPSQVHTNLMYTGGLRINIGAPAKRVDALYNDRIASIREEQNDKINELRATYQKRLKQINKELDVAIQENDSLKMAALLEEHKQVTAAEAQEVEKVIKASNQAVVAEQEKPSTTITPQAITTTKTMAATCHKCDKSNETMTGAEFQALVEEVVAKVKAQQNLPAYRLSDTDMQVVLRALQPNTTTITTTENTAVDQKTEAMLKELRQMIQNVDKKVNVLSTKAASQPVEKQITIVPQATTPAPQTLVAPATTPTPAAYVAPQVQPAAVAAQSGSILHLNELSLYTGPSFGQQFTWNVGIRANMQISNTNLDFMPELYFGASKNSAYGISGNVVYNLNTSWTKVFQPYAGLGLGVFKHKNVVFGTNVILGVSAKFGRGKFFVDYSVRQLFKNNQIAIGYRFVF